MRTWANITPIDPVVHACGEDVIVSTVTMRAQACTSGKAIAMPMCQVIRFSDELPIQWRNFAWDTARMLHVLGLSAGAA